MNFRRFRFFILFSIAVLLSTNAIAAEVLPSVVISTNILWSAFVTALLMLLLLGLSLLMASRYDDVMANTIMFKATLGSAWAVLLFAVVGYGLMFGQNTTGLWGTSLFFFDNSAGLSIIFYSVLAALTVFIAGGAVAAYLSYRVHLMVSMLLLLLFAVAGSWVWGEMGWLHVRGFVDIAGSTVVHSVAGWMALAALIGLGRRNDAATEPAPASNTGLSGMAIILIWLGWFGLALGATLYSSYTLPEAAAELVLMNTLLAGCAGMIAASLASYMVNQKLDLRMIALGCIAGLVSISAGVAIMLPTFAILTGFIGGSVAVFSLLILRDLRIDDSTAVISAHALPGVWGTLAAGVFYSGDFFNPDRVLVQMMGVVSIFAFVFVITWLLFRMLRKVLSTDVENTSR